MHIFQTIIAYCKRKGTKNCTVNSVHEQFTIRNEVNSTESDRCFLTTAARYLRYKPGISQRPQLRCDAN